MRCVDSIYSRYSRSFPDTCTTESGHLLILRVPYRLQPAVQAFLTHVKATPDPDRFQIPAVRGLVCQSARNREPDHVIRADVALFFFPFLFLLHVRRVPSAPPGLTQSFLVTIRVTGNSVQTRSIPPRPVFYTMASNMQGILYSVTDALLLHTPEQANVQE